MILTSLLMCMFMPDGCCDLYIIGVPINTSKVVYN
jgi:hypothetical protein